MNSLQRKILEQLQRNGEDLRAIRALLERFGDKAVMGPDEFRAIQQIVAVMHEHGIAKTTRVVGPRARHHRQADAEARDASWPRGHTHSRRRQPGPPSLADLPSLG